MEAAVCVQNLSRREIKSAACRSNDAVCNVLGLAEAPDRRNTLLDQLLIFFLYHCSHICHNDTRTNFEDRNSVFRQLVCKQLRDHGNPGLLMQYSPRFVDEVYADMEEMFTILGW